MAMGRQGARQDQMMVLWDELPRSPGHVFYDRLQRVLRDAGFDAFAEKAVPAVLCDANGRAVAAAGPLLPDAPGWLL